MWAWYLQWGLLANRQAPVIGTNLPCPQQHLNSTLYPFPGLLQLQVVTLHGFM